MSKATKARQAKLESRAEMVRQAQQDHAERKAIAEIREIQARLAHEANVVKRVTAARQVKAVHAVLEVLRESQGREAKAAYQVLTEIEGRLGKEASAAKKAKPGRKASKVRPE